ncbi:MAG: hypothetical protein JSW10_08225 [Pseudomonadota bacterium]|nr:MAG: hypothetical protein JSW10_08225 [Pseudomonadota bacterium]
MCKVDLFAQVMLLVLALGILVVAGLVVKRSVRCGAAANLCSRTVLLQRVRRLRLAKMVEHLGVDLGEYIARMPRAAIARHIQNCRRCSDVDTCDAIFRDGRRISDMHFCPNYGSLNANSKNFVAK